MTNRIANVYYFVKETKRLIIPEANVANKFKRDYMTRQDWVRKVIPLELRKKLKSNDATKCYMHKAESVLKMRRIN